MSELFQQFEDLLKNAGFKGTFGDLLEQWHSILFYTKRYLNPSATHYLKVWRRLFDSARRDEWNLILLLIELLFCIPVSNAKVERLFFLIKRIKTDCRASRGEVYLNNLVRICMEGPGQMVHSEDRTNR